MFQTVIPSKLGLAALTTSEAAIVTVPDLARAFVKTIDVCNTTAGPLTFDLYLVPDGETAGTDNALAYQVSLGANSLFQWTGTQILDAGDTIQAKASAAGITVHVSGGVAV